ncbi:MAG: hypothetical protein PHO91_02180 [Patescibacteria group bacterium]|nr:hypothetical protein [Patescibacteria group bacterium]
MSDEKSGCQSSLPKGEWRCLYCGQAFCNPVSCWQKIKKERGAILASVNPQEQTQGDASMSQEKQSNQSNDRSQQPAEPCHECGAVNGHTVRCSYNIAYLI